MPSLRARLVEMVIPLLGVKKFFEDTQSLDARIAKIRLRKPERPRKKWHRKFDVSESQTHGFPVVTYAQQGGQRDTGLHLLYLHGGGYVMDIASVHWDAVGKLCEQLGASASVPLYPLAPETKAADTLAGVQALYLELAQRYGSENIVVMGDSAGGGMTLALAQMLALEGGPMPSSLVLFSPWLDASVSGDGQAAIEKDDVMLAVAGLEACAERYAGDLPLDDPRLSPLFGPLEKLPPIATFAGTHDILLVDARRLDGKLSQTDRENDIYREYEAMFHVWMIFPIPEAKQALDETCQFIRAHHKGSTK